MLKAFRRIPLSNHFNLRLAMSTVQAPLNSYLSVHVKCKATDPRDFYLKTLENARNSILETGISRFDVLRDIDAKDEFVLLEVYNTKEDPDEHKKTSHYNNWREGVAPLMAVPRSAVKYRAIFPVSESQNWKTESSAHKIDPQTYSADLPWDYNLTADANSYHLGGLLVVIVDVNVTPGQEEAFIEASLKNCRESIKEGGVHRFDLLQNIENQSNFVLMEAYNSPAGPIAHKASEHYNIWAKEVAGMMATPRASKKYASLFPSPLYWHQASRITHPGEGAGLSSSTGMKGLSAVSGHSFTFLGPKIAFGRNIASKAIASSIKDLKITRPFFVFGKSGIGRYGDLLKEALSGLQFDVMSSSYSVQSEPTVEDAIAAINLAKAMNSDGVLAIGGGSAIDLGKVVAALLVNAGDIYDYLEVIGKGMPIQNPPVPFIAVPTTSGTGSEATKNSVLKSIKFARKASIRHDSMIADIAIVDPVLTVSCPKGVTAHVGLDTLCQVIEPFVSNSANPIVDALAKEGILRASRSLRDAVSNGDNIEAREDLSVASLLGGISLANAKLGAVHGYAAVLGGMYDNAPHGAICAALLPHVFQKNCEKLWSIIQSTPSSDSKFVDAKIRLERFVEVARLITGNPRATYQEGVAWLHALIRDLEVPRLTTLCPGMSVDHIDTIAESTAVASSTKGNPVVLSVDELRAILRQAM